VFSIEYGSMDNASSIQFGGRKLVKDSCWGRHTDEPALANQIPGYKISEDAVHDFEESTNLQHIKYYILTIFIVH
jgi:hypothetical protein